MMRAGVRTKHGSEDTFSSQYFRNHYGDLSFRLDHTGRSDCENVLQQTSKAKQLKRISTHLQLKSKNSL